MFESSKAMKRRFNDGAFHTQYFVGDGVDVGAGPDGISSYAHVFPRMGNISDWDIQDGDAQYLASIEDNALGFVHASHNLEHLVDPMIAVHNWLRVLKPGGHIICTVPDFRMYEHSCWPSKYGQGHLWAFGVESGVRLEKYIFLPGFLTGLPDNTSIERLMLIRDFFSEAPSGDQTMLPNVECSIEFVIKKLR